MNYMLYVTRKPGFFSTWFEKLEALLHAAKADEVDEVVEKTIRAWRSTNQASPGQAAQSITIATSTSAGFSALVVVRPP